MELILIEIMLVVSILGWLMIVLTQFGKNKKINISTAATTVEELEFCAKRAALMHIVTSQKIVKNFPLKRVNENYEFIKLVCQDLNEDIQRRKSVPPAAEWILDNFYVIEERTKNLRRDLTKKEYLKLPVIKSGSFKGYTRVLAIAMEFVSIVDGQIDEGTLIKYLEAYQSHNILFDRELRVIPMMLQIALLESVRAACETIKEAQKQWRAADVIVDKWWSEDKENEDKLIAQFKMVLGKEVDADRSFIEHLVYRFRRSGKNYVNLVRFLNEFLMQFGTTLEAITQKEHNTQAVVAVTMGNDLMSFKNISSINWAELFETLSFVEKILRQDPNDVYGNMDAQSRGYYLQQIEKSAKEYGVSERHIAQTAIGLAEKVAKTSELLENIENDQIKRSHVGYYLIGEGRKELEKIFQNNDKRYKRVGHQLIRHQGRLYIWMIILIIAICVGITICYGMNQIYFAHWRYGILIGVAMLIPASEVSISVINWIVGRTKQPAFFPRLELKEGIPSELSTMVVVPTLLGDINRVEELLKHIECHYLANKEKNLYFALIGGFKDSIGESTIENNPILKSAQTGMDKLNRRYAIEGNPIFYFFHRKNMYNEVDLSWTGWERKRGALMEFNALLSGEKNTSFISSHNGYLEQAKIKYIITLDADTVLPLGMAKKMIGTMAHPQNIPIIDPIRKVVVEGHGLMQPRISFDMDSSNRSIFSRIYTGQEGIDPYANAISDVYQDLFDEGIFTGKGIYDLKVFKEVLENVIPENAVLSHDLLEGSYVRAALVTDLELVDSYPSKYNAYVARMRRWIRGDWQLIPWLRRNVNNKNNKKVSNPLSYLSIWKIGDNLRRSLVGPSLIILIILAICILPGNLFFWLGCVAIVLVLPLILHFLDWFAGSSPNLRSSKRHIMGFFGFKSSLFQIILTIIFLPYQSMVVINAIIITLVRVLITKKNMLEWITSDDAEKMQSCSLGSYLLSMGTSSLFGIILAVISILFHPENFVISLVFIIIWGGAPFIAYFISKDKTSEKEMLEQDELLELRKIARKTWRYFEEFANKKNNYLAPDNYQEEPYRGIAYRTSPTNIGLGLLATLSARDLGYINLEEWILKLERTIGTVEQLEKWKGHLCNWYDTKTLEVLKPKYISTVDSGNFVCYLVTLRQGLIEYRSRPLVHIAMMNGMEDTYSCGTDKKETFFDAEVIENFKLQKDQISLLEWKKMLESALTSPRLEDVISEAWKYKLEHMIQENKKRMQQWMPWVDRLTQVPNLLTFDKKRELGQKLLNLLDTNISLDQYQNHCIVIQDTIKQVLKIMEKNENRVEDELLLWLEKVNEDVEKGLAHMGLFAIRYEKITNRIFQLAEEVEFAALYEKKRQLFSIGFNLEDNRLSNSYYDLLASEARQTSFLAIARGEVPAKHWYMLGRSLTVVDRYKGLVSWSGTMFEYLMPLMIMKNYKNTLLDETYSFVVKSQKKYGKERHMPWGASESGFSSLDMHLDYQYKAIGVPWLGLKRGLIEDAVTAPYATFLALLVNPLEAYKNIKYLKAEGLEGAYGYFEAADYTPERLSKEQDKIIIKSYMAHHQGMSLLSLNNYLHQNIMQKRFSAEPYVEASCLLLQERVPANIVYTKEDKEKIVPYKGTTYYDQGSYRYYTKPDAYFPKAHVLSNGYYSVVTTDKGTGYSRTKEYAITRWRKDATIDNYGMFFYIRNKETGENWSAAYAPLNQMPKEYEVAFTADKTLIKRVNGAIETKTEIIVTSGDFAEIRRIKLKNNEKTSCELEITSYYEVVMAEQNSDEAHPAFSNLFVETEFNEEFQALLAHRRRRGSEEKELWLAHMAIVDGEQVADVQYETDRMKFVGRGHTVSDPVALERERPLSNSVGNVLDPIFSLRCKVKVLSGKSARISFVTMVASSKEQMLDLLAKYNSVESCDAAFWLAVIRSQVETKYLNVKAHEMELYQDMVSDILFLSPRRRMCAKYIEKNHKGQSSLWAYGVSGDRPIVVAFIQKMDDVGILYELLKAHEYWRLKDLRVDLVILVMEEYTYENPVLSMVRDIVDTSQYSDVLHKKEDVFILSLGMTAKDDQYLFASVARLCFYGNKGSMDMQKREFEKSEVEKRELTANLLPILEIENSDLWKELEALNPNESVETEMEISTEELEFYNGIGGFSRDYQRYVIDLKENQTTPLPWSNIIANEEFGFMVTESGGGYTWCSNSRENKLTPWTNDSVSDELGEIFYLRDEAANVWSLTPQPIREKNAYVIEHGFGFTSFKHISHGLNQKLTQFVPVHGNIKVSILELKNEGMQERQLAITYYIKPVLGVNASETAPHLITNKEQNGIITVKNGYNQEFANQVLFVDTSIEERSVTGDRRTFIGQGSVKSPEELYATELSNQVGAGYDPCVCMQVKITILPGETLPLVFVMGIASSENELDSTIRNYKTIEGAKTALNEVKAFWKEKLGILQVITPDAATNQMMNGHLLYQVIACRLWARTAFYQAGGAYGFRDQLQDTLALLPIWPELTKKQILKNAGRQFEEGDVLHWWHEPAVKGTRTRISDDFLWLPYAVAEYLGATEDEMILKEEIAFIECDQLKDGEVERYVTPGITEAESSLYDHCIRSIEYGLRFGKHGLPLMGCGDWNDGMNRVGNEGKGESIWLAWFLISILKKWEPICLKNNDLQRSLRYSKLYHQLLLAVEKHGWDGSWYKRAYFDDGSQLGAANNRECKIDSLAQTWSVLSGEGNLERIQNAMSSVEDYLVNKKDGIIRLLTPPFDNGQLEPGYIKGYVPGVRENGGQYTHAAAWVVAAFAKLGQGDKAFELFDMINPVNHARTNTELAIYKVEPYVMAADVYSCSPYTGRGGWSWYTGAAGWMYQVGLGSILGFQKKGNQLSINPCIPKKWVQFSIQYTYEQTIYDIQVSNPDAICQGKVNIKVNGLEIENSLITMIKGQGILHIEVEMKAEDPFSN